MAYHLLKIDILLAWAADRRLVGRAGSLLQPCVIARSKPTFAGYFFLHGVSSFEYRTWSIFDTMRRTN